MSSTQKSWPPAQVDDSDGGVAVAIAVKTKVSDEEFVKKWMSCDSYCVMAFNTDMTVSAVQARATRLRKAGVQLPTFTRAERKRKGVDVTSLNSIIETTGRYEPKSETKGETINE